MFIRNIEELTRSKLFYCTKSISDILIKHGFSLLSIRGNTYIYMLTEKLETFLIENDLKGGE